MRGSFVAALAACVGLASMLGGCVEIPTQKPVGSAPAAPQIAPLPPPPPPTTYRNLSNLPGWGDDDHASALSAFQAGCGVARAPVWAALCAKARAQGAADEIAARAFFEANFSAEVTPLPGLLTAYFAPEYPAETTPNEIFSAPVIARPEDLVMAPALPDDPGGRRIGMRRLDGALVPYPDRAEIEARQVGRTLAFMRPEDLFFLQIQGSGSLVFPDGRRLKAIYAGDNGRPFVAIARPMVEEGLLAPGHTSGDAIRAWLADHRGAEADAVMNKDPRYVFFDLVPEDGRDPAGAAGVPLPAGRSIAVDPAYHPYGELYWLDAAAPGRPGAAKTYRRLVVALDTGSAIRGDARADLYLGRGEAAGSEAGRVRHTLLLVRLIPKAGEPQHETAAQNRGG